METGEVDVRTGLGAGVGLSKKAERADAEVGVIGLLICGAGGTLCCPSVSCRDSSFSYSSTIESLSEETDESSEESKLDSRD